MEQIVLKTNLKYVIEILSMAQRGEVLTALFSGSYGGDDETVKNVFYFLMTEIEAQTSKREKMRALGLKSAAARMKKGLLGSAKNDDDKRLFEQPLNDGSKRKEAKENNNINKNNLFFYSLGDKKSLSQQNTFISPSVEEVRAYIDKNKLSVDAETFVNFYESHGWMVGTTPIRSWQATLKLWHGRALKGDKGRGSDPPNQQDETYWSELAQRRSLGEVDNDILTHPISTSVRQNLPLCEKNMAELDLDLDCQPFERFINRVKKYDIKSENNDDKKQ